MTTFADAITANSTNLLRCSASVASWLGRAAAAMLQYEEETPLLHGTLQVQVFAARDLPDTDNALFNISRGDWTDPFVEIGLVGRDNNVVHVCKTAYLKNNLDPEWDDEIFRVPVCHHASSLRVNVMDREHIGAERVGSVEVDVSLLLDGEEVGLTSSSVYILLVVLIGI